MENACSGGVPAMPPPSSTCADSSDSSPRSRAGEPLDEPYLNATAAAAAAAPKFRFMCSYGGHIVPRPHDKSLCYLGGETRIVVVERHTTLSDLSSKLSRSLLSNRPFTLKYQLPSEDLDSLISVTTDEDLDNMIEEYDRIAAAASGKASRLRLFLFPVKVESPCPSTSSIGSLLDDSKSETWFVDALNGAIGAGGVLPRGLSGDSGASSVNCLLGLEDEHNNNNNNNPAIVPQPLANVTAGFSEHNNDLHNLAPSHHTDHTAQLQLPLPRPDSNGKLKVGHEVHSVPDSPMMDTTSSFGSASSAPSLSHLPPIRVRQDDQSPQKRGFGLEEQFSHMNFHKQEDDFKPRVLAHVAIPLAAVAPTPFATPPMAASPRENPGHAGRAVSSDEEKLEIPCSRKLPQIPLAQQQNVTNAPAAAASFDIPVSDRPVYYEERTDPAVATWDTVSDVKKEVQSSAPESNYRAQVQVSEQGYVLPVQPDHLQQQQLQEQQPQKQQHQPHHHQQQQQPQEQQQQSQQQQQQQQYTHAAPHLVQHHPSNPSSHLIPQHPSAQMIPIQSYYQMHQIHPQQQLPQNIPFNSQIPMYFVQIPQNPAYAVPIQQPNLVDGSMVSAKPAIPMPSQILQPRGVASQNPDLAATSNVYRTNATTASVVSQSSPAPQLIHMGDQTHQFIPGYQRVQHHPSQSAASTYGYEFSNQLLSQPMFYGQAVSNPLPSHYQAISSAATVMSHSQPQLQQQQQQVLDGNHNKASS